MSWTLAPCLREYINEANTLAPNRSKSSDGTVGDTAHQSRPSDHNPDARGIVHAVDLTHDPTDGWDAHARVEELRVKKDVRIKYVISNDRIFTSYQVGSRDPWEWGPYNPNNPHRNRHIKHAHLSVKSGDIYELDVSPWFDEEDDMTDEEKKKLEFVYQAVKRDKPGGGIEGIDKWLDRELKAINVKLDALGT